MIASEIARHRLYNQRISREGFETPNQMVAWLGAMQAQDFAGVQWAVGLRCRATQAAVAQAFLNQTIVRTWLMRGTLHIVAATDVRWILDLAAPRVVAQSARRYRQLGLDDATFARSYETLTMALADGRCCTRAELMAALEAAGIATRGQRGYHILRRAGLEGVLCFGPGQEQQQTFVLLGDWAAENGRQRDEALAELAGRYFRSHGPATLKDFVWWSGLKTAVARTALAAAGPRLHQETIDGRTYWRPADGAIVQEESPTVHLLPAYDAYYLGYRARNAVLSTRYDKEVVSSNGVFRPMVVVDGQIVGIWRQTVKEETIAIEPELFRSLTAAESDALLTSAKQYSAFLGRQRAEMIT